MTVAPAAPHTDAVITALEDADILVGRGEKPDGGGWQGEPGRSAFVAYAVMYPTPGLPQPANLADPHGNLVYTFQLTCVGATQRQAEVLLDAAKTALVGVRLSVSGRSTGQVYLDAPSQVTRDDQVSPPLHYATPQFRFISTAA